MYIPDALHNNPLETLPPNVAGDMTDELRAELGSTDIQEDDDFTIKHENISSIPIQVAFQNINGRKYPIPARWAFGSVVKHILNHNEIQQFTGVTIIGMSGSGKTTVTRKLIHDIHENGGNYIVKWFTGDDIVNLDTIVKSLTVGYDHIIVFDDSTYSSDDVDGKTLRKIAQTLTTIRHIVKAKVIAVTIIHYSKALAKFFRAVPFTIYTSINAEEMGNYEDLYKTHRNVIRSFARMYNQMTLKKYFECSVDNYSGKKFHYSTNKPFRICMVEESSDLHFAMYWKDTCAGCFPDDLPIGEKTSEEIAKIILEAFPALRRFHVPFSYWAFYRTNVADSIPKGHRIVRDYLDKLASTVQPSDGTWSDVLDKTKKITEAGKGLRRIQGWSQPYPDPVIKTKRRLYKHNAMEIDKLAQEMKSEMDAEIIDDNENVVEIIRKGS